LKGILYLAATPITNESNLQPSADSTHKMGLPTLLQPRPSSGKPSLRPQRPSFFGRVASMHLRCRHAIHSWSCTIWAIVLTVLQRF